MGQLAADQARPTSREIPPTRRVETRWRAKGEAAAGAASPPFQLGGQARLARVGHLQDQQPVRAQDAVEFPQRREPVAGGHQMLEGAPQAEHGREARVGGRQSADITDREAQGQVLAPGPSPALGDQGGIEVDRQDAVAGSGQGDGDPAVTAAGIKDRLAGPQQAPQPAGVGSGEIRGDGGQAPGAELAVEAVARGRRHGVLRRLA